MQNLLAVQHIKPLLLSTSLLFSSCILYLLNSYEKTKLTYQPTPKNQNLLSRCPSLATYGPIPLWGFLGSAQTSLMEKFFQGQPHCWKRDYLTTAEKVTFALDWIYSDRLNEKTSIVLLVTSFGDETSTLQVKTFCRYFSDNGFRVAVLYWPGCCDSDLTSPKLDIYGDQNILPTAISHISAVYPSAFQHVMGLFLGGNLLLRYLESFEPPSVLISCVCLSPAFELDTGLDVLLSENFKSILLQKWLSVLEKHLWMFKSDKKVDFEGALKAKSFGDLDARFTLRVLGCSSFNELYKSHSCIKSLRRLSIPCLILTSGGTNFLKCLEESEKNPNLIFANTRFGGDMVWAKGFLLSHRETWKDVVVLEFMSSVEKELTHNKEQ